MAHYYLNIGHIDSVFRFPSCGSVSAEERERYSITNGLVYSSSSLVPWSENAWKSHNVLEGKFTFSHFLIQFIERWFNQFPSLWWRFSTTTYFRHFFSSKNVRFNTLSTNHDSCLLLLLVHWNPAHSRLTVENCACKILEYANVLQAQSAPFWKRVSFEFWYMLPRKKIMNDCNDILN